jgi:hypothetical protein
VTLAATDSPGKSFYFKRETPAPIRRPAQTSAFATAAVSATAWSVRPPFWNAKNEV